MNALTPVGQAAQALASAKTPAESKQVEAMAAAGMAWAKEQGDFEAVVTAGHVYILARRKTTALIEPHINPRGGRPKNSDTDVTVLEDFNLTRKQWQRRREELEVPDHAVDGFIDECVTGRFEPTLKGLLRFWHESAPQESPLETPALPSGKYRCIVVDPPWPMEKIEREVRPNQGRKLDYPTMTLEEIAALPIQDLAVDDGCHLYLWVTHRFLPDGLALMESWGFRYQCVMTWVKPVGITPYSWMYDTEHVLFGRRGHLKLQQLGLRLSFSAPLGGHSVKPGAFFDRVRNASPAPRLEMFARLAHDGFTAWGNEVSNG